MTNIKSLCMLALCWVTTVFAAPTALFGAPPSDIMPPEKAFQVSVGKVTPESITLDFVIAPKTYLYQQAFGFISPQADMGPPVFPKAKSIKDPFLGTTNIYRQSVEITLPIEPPLTKPIEMTVTYQGCHDVGFCYPPQNQTLTIMPPLNTQPAPTANAVAPTVTGMPASMPLDVLAKQNGWALLAFMGFGILLSFTPCVLPMVPILSALILGEQQKHHPLKAFGLAASYVAGMALTYAALGALVGSLGARVQAQFQNPWVLSSTAALLVLFAGVLVHDKPQAFLSRLSGAFHQLSHALPRGEYISVALMGVLASIVISPCVTPPLVGALTFITLEGNVLFGSLALFMLGLGMGLPLLAVTWLGTAVLPKRGPWMERVKHILAVLLVMMAIDLLTRFLPGSVALMMYGALAVGVGFWLKPFSRRRGMQRLWQALSWVALLMGAIWIVGGAMGNSDWRSPLRSEASRMEHALPYTVVKTPEALAKALIAAHVSSKPAFVDFYADWCVACVYMERTVLMDEAVQKALEPYALIQVDLTHSNDDTQTLLKTWQLFGPPAFLFFDAQGVELKAARVNGEIDRDALLAHLEHIRQSSENSMPSP